MYGVLRFVYLFKFDILKINFFFLKKNFKLVAVPRESHGIFFKGDAYVIYHAEEIKKSTGSSSTTPTTLIQHIHFWIGSEATQDEAGVAAYKTVELGRIYFCFIKKRKENISSYFINNHFLLK